MIKIPTCHPDKRYASKGLCAMCYMKAYRILDSTKTREASKRYYRLHKNKVLRAAKKYREARGSQFFLKNLLKSVKQRAVRRGLDFNLTVEKLVVPTHCPVFGIQLELYRRGTRDSRPSIDRIDNTKGYTLDNVVIVSCRANRFKSDSTPEELRRLARFYSRLEKETIDNHSIQNETT